ncbi:RNB domain-containing ribonuclease [Anaerolineales bacterium HSG24]|nr:RNB domain-containing ribonuclease [Anaerolineales bacterium HSG24]
MSNQQQPLTNGALVLYKDRAGLIEQVSDKITVSLKTGKTIKVRPKDITLLHPGPLKRLADLSLQPGDVETAWELLAGTQTELEELAELIYNDFTPATAWATWLLVVEGVYFRGTPTDITVRSAEQIERDRTNRETKLAQAQAWNDFVERAKSNQLLPDDSHHLTEVESLAYEQRESSRLLEALKIEETPNKAHQFLLRLEHWDNNVNPYPQRHQVNLDLPDLELPPLPEEERLDLTHLPAFAIDDEESNDPDDALSLVAPTEPGNGWAGYRLWVHVADVAALVTPDSPIDLEARARGATLYIPETTLTMLPRAVRPLLALGLSEISPALSFGIELDETGNISQVDITPSWIKVTRLTYTNANKLLHEEPLRSMAQLALSNHNRRLRNGAIQLDLPECKIRVVDGQVTIKQLPPLQSRELVTEAMLMAGEGVAKFAIEHEIPFPFSSQESPQNEPDYDIGLAGMFALRRTLKRSQMSTIPNSHAGLGLSAYSQATSPLRRYLDLVVHQQLRAFLQDAPLLSSSELLERVGSVSAVMGNMRQAERLSHRHWTYVYLLQHPDWQGEGILVDRRKLRGLVLIPELNLETSINLPDEFPLNSQLFLKLKRVRLADLDASFKIIATDEE